MLSIAISAQASSKLQHFDERLAAGEPVKLVLYGDSISEVGRSPRWHGGASSPETNWGARLVEKLAAAHPEGQFEIGFFGIGGQNTYEGLGRLDALAAFQPDLVLVAFGANDCSYHFLQPEQTALALTTLVKDIKKRYGADVVVVSTAGDNPHHPFFRHLDETVAAQRAVADETGVPFVDTRRAILEATEGGSRWANYHLNQENCHPNDAGHQVWADATFEVIRANSLVLQN